MALRPQYVAPELLTKVTKTLGITALDQWYHVSHHAATKAIGTRALRKYGGTIGFLKSAYPHHHFDEEKLLSRRNIEKDQKFMEVIIRKLFPNTEIVTKAKKAVGIINPETEAYLEIDFWIPSLKLGIEYQDKHHYDYQWYANDALEDYRKRDNIKKVAMSNLGYTLITIGFWWDKTIESIAATIRKFRPDLLPEYQGVSAEPIPSDPPLELSASPVIPGVVGIMSPFVPNNNFDPSNWYAGEKYDGIRGVYNPESNIIFSRSGKELSVLPSLLHDIPQLIIEGEIMAGRGNYVKTTAVSYHSHHGKVDWPMFRYVVYDIPKSDLGSYIQRYTIIANGFSTQPFIFAQPAFRILVVDKAHLKMLVDMVIRDSGEGVIVQKDAQYEYGRAKGLAKIKVRRDADAQILRVNKHSCTCKLVSGVTAEILFSADFNPSTLKEGDIVSYYHKGYSPNGKPLHPEIFKVRYDLTWGKLLSEQNALKRRSVKEAIGGGLHNLNNIVKNRMGHWNKAPNVRAFFDEFARTNGFDPLVPENWYSVRTTTLQNAKGGGLINVYTSKTKALKYAYPELKFDMEKFRTHTIARNKKKHGYWSNFHNVRAYFDEFANTNGFDPLVPENWLSVKYSSLLNAKGGGPLNAYGFKLRRALSSAYPEVKFAEEKFRTHASRGFWNKSANVRAFFGEFASTAGFDPLVAENWYKVGTRAVHRLGGSGLLNAYNHNFHESLSNAYPELAFEQERFQNYTKQSKT